MDFHVDLSIFRGPLDLLLYLVRKHEVEIVDIPIALITDQYLQYMDLLEQLDVGAVGDFLAMASLLIEIKSQQVLPRADEVEEELEDPRQELVRRLLEYKQYRDAASMLDERSRAWQQRYRRVAADLPPRPRNLAAEPIREVELWDLVAPSAGSFARTWPPSPPTSSTTTRPSTCYMERILARLNESGRLALSELLDANLHKSVLISMFLAVLELVRHHRGQGRTERPVRRDLDPARGRGSAPWMPLRWTIMNMATTRRNRQSTCRSPKPIATAKSQLFVFVSFPTPEPP